MENNFLGFIDEFFDFIEELKQFEGFKTTIKENIYRVCKRDRNKDYGKIIVSKGCYNKIADKKGCNAIAFDYVVNKHNLTYTLEKIIQYYFLKRGLKPLYITRKNSSK